MRRIAVSSVLVFGIAGAIVIFLAKVPARTAATPDVTSGVPEEVQQEAVGYASQYGTVSEVYFSSTTTVANWAKEEPGRAGGYFLPSEDGTLKYQPTDAVYAVFVHGEFRVPTPSGESVTYTGARFIVDTNGVVISEWMWNHADPKTDTGFGSTLDDPPQ